MAVEILCFFSLKKQRLQRTAGIAPKKTNIDWLSIKPMCRQFLP
jgi:hypothetical protein